MNAIKALVGLVLIPLYHLPRLVCLLLLASYAFVFNNPHNLTASPAEHIKRARRLLRGGRNSELLYAALELRFAVERMADHQLAMAEAASRRMLDQVDPKKKIRNLNRLDANSRYPHEIYFVNAETGQRVRWGEYKPLDEARIGSIKGRLGAVLHPKRGLLLGVTDDPWYTDTRRFLQETTQYLSDRYRDNTPFFALAGVKGIEMLRIETDETG
ncbi:MAG TPA: hypothetical protein VGK32_04180 [Vicinamibacterales bacterium]|jgi:hypothetical protein